MGYTVDLLGADLRCRSEADTRAATALVKTRAGRCPRHLEVAPWSLANPPRDDAWALSIEYFGGEAWDDEEARELWLALAPHLASGATIEFQGEDFSRWRIRWEAGRVFEEYPKEVVWALTGELLQPCTDPAPVTNREE